jgi:hypothetical protein
MLRTSLLVYNSYFFLLVDVFKVVHGIGVVELGGFGVEGDFLLL